MTDDNNDDDIDDKDATVVVYLFLARCVAALALASHPSDARHSMDILANIHTSPPRTMCLRLSSTVVVSRAKDVMDRVDEAVTAYAWRGCVEIVVPAAGETSVRFLKWFRGANATTVGNDIGDAWTHELVGRNGNGTEMVIDCVFAARGVVSAACLLRQFECAIRAWSCIIWPMRVRQTTMFLDDERVSSFGDAETRARARALSSMCVVSSTKRSCAGIGDWCAVCTLTLEPKSRRSEESDAGWAQACVNGSVLPWMEQFFLFERLLTFGALVKDRFALDGVLPSIIEPNVEHVLRFTNRDDGCVESAMRLKSLTIHYILAPGLNARLKDGAPVGMPLAECDSKTSTRVNPVPSDVSSALFNACIVDALQILKRRMVPTLGTPQERRTFERTREIGRKVLAILLMDGALSSAEANAFVEEREARDPEWRVKLLQKLSRISALRENDRDGRVEELPFNL